MLASREPKTSIRGKVGSVKRTVDSQRLTEASRPPAEIPLGLHAAPPAHEIETFERLQSTHQNARAAAISLTR
jgi:hypothetical protein